jgi:hypothetical protein
MADDSVDFGGHDRPPEPPATTSSPGRASAPRVRVMSRRAGMAMVCTGVLELDRELEAICADEGPKSLNTAMRGFAREVVKEIVLPKVQELVPYDDGRGAYKADGQEIVYEHNQYKGAAQHLADQIVLKAVSRSRKRIGFLVGFEWPLFQGPTYYGAYIEFGWDHRAGFHVEADSFLRRALYPEASRIVESFRGKVAAYIAERNLAAPENTPSAF